MGTFFKLQWSYCGFHAGGIYEWGYFSNFSGATVVFMLVEYMNGDIFQTSVELLCHHHENHSSSTEVGKMPPFIYSTSMKTTVAPLKFEKCPHSYIPPA
jgi:hypothetical protein